VVDEVSGFRVTLRIHANNKKEKRNKKHTVLYILYNLWNGEEITIRIKKRTVGTRKIF
jgi:hypothetical protein